MQNNTLSSAIVQLKSEYTRKINSKNHIQEVIPLRMSPKVPLDKSILLRLNDFASCNNIYNVQKDVEVCGIKCRSYEGDINHYWLSSKKYDTNYQPFYPTWILSAFALAEYAKKLGYSEIVDIGSGDGRIAYCGTLIGMRSISIEIDSELVNLQKSISSKTGINYAILNEDAIEIHYNKMDLCKPIFFISGLPEHGEMLATNVLTKIGSSSLRLCSGFNFMGSHIMKEYTRDHTLWGWGRIIHEYNLQVMDMLTLPTFWTTDQKIDTAYVFARFN